MNQPPAFQFYADDFIGGTVDFSAKEVGHYMRLLCYQWSHGSIPADDERRLNLICGGKPSSNVRAKFPKVDSVWVNSRMETERKKQQDFREERSKSGLIGADKRWHSHGSANGTAINQPMAKGMANDGSPSPSPSPVSKEREEGAPALSEIPTWEEFWEFCKSPRCGISAEWFAKDKFLAQDAKGWHQIKWKKYALRVRGWWDNDGRPMTPPQKNGTATGPKKSYLQMPG